MEKETTTSTKDHRHVGKFVRYQRTKFTWPEYGIVSSATDESLWVRFYNKNALTFRCATGERVGIDEITFMSEKQLKHSHRINNLFFLISDKVYEITNSEHFTTIEEFFTVLRAVIAYHIEVKYGSVRDGSLASGIPRKTLANWKKILRKEEQFPE